MQQTWDDLPTHDRGIDLDAFIVMPKSRERYLPKQGGFETRPYHAKERPLGTQGLPLGVRSGGPSTCR